MADQPSSPAARELNTTPSEQGTPNPTSNQSDPLPVSSSSTPTSAPAPPPASVAVNLNSNPPLINQQPASIPSYAPPPMSAGAVLPPTAPSFRPAPPQFSPLPNHQNPNFQNHMMQPPGVNPVPGSPMMPYHIPPGQHPNPAMRQYAPMSNGYTTMPMPPPQGAIPPGVRYPSPYPAMVRPAFPLRPPGAIGVFPVLPRPPVPGIQGIRPVIPVRPALVPVVTPAEKPQTTVYVGKIALTVEDDFMLSLLRLCGPVKDWKRARDPKDGTPKGFGFCEFESAEGVLRALRLLSKLNVDRQELVLNVNKATREYLGRYVEKKTENSKKLKETEAEGAEKEDNVGPGPDMNETTKPSVEDTKKDDNNSENKDNQDSANFGIVTDEDREADREASEKLTAMMEERAKNKPLPLPPPPPLPPALAIGDGSGNLTSELPTKSRDGDSDVDIMRSDGVEDKNDEDTTSEKKPPNEHDRADTSSPDRNRKYDRRSRDRDRDLKREKEREFEKLEKETQRERERKERERERKIQEAERAEREYKEFVSSWESREREKEKQRQYEKEREKDRERKRKKEIKDEETDDNDSRKRMRRSLLDEKRRKRIREKEDDLDDRLREEEEIAEANRRAIEEEKQQQQEKDALKLLSGHMTDQSVKAELAEETNAGSEDTVTEHAEEGDSSHEKHTGDVILQNGTGDESTMSTMTSSETRQGGNVPAKKLGFGLVGSGKRTAVPSVFYEEEDEDARNDKKMRPLVPIDYSTEELQAVQPSNNTGAAPPNLAAAAEFAKRISNSGSKEDKPDIEKERSRRSHDKRDRVRNDEDSNHARDENREKIPERDRDREHGLDKLKTPDNRKLLDAKQLIDMIPKTKEELFSYEINWDVYDKHDLHERMQPWISKKITEFLGEEETTLVDYIVSRTREHVKASQMLDQLQTILDDEAEMFVLKLWRMLIFEIKKVETGLAMRSKS